MHPVSIGVDFGTSNTVIAMAGADRSAAVLKVRSRAGQAAALPSILCFQPSQPDARHRPISSAGTDAIADYIVRTGPARLAQSMKSFLGSKSFIDTIGGIPLGYLADRANRKTLIALSISAGAP